jgi:hypothetical protein
MIAIAQSLASSVRQFLNKLFSRFRASSPAVIQKAPEEPPRKPRKYNQEKRQDFSELLDKLEYTFNFVKLPTMRESWLANDSVIGLKKLGVHVPNPALIYWDAEKKLVDITKPLPAIMCVSQSSAHTLNTDKKLYAKFIFAIKLDKLPWQVAKQTGVPYQFGMSFDVDGKLFWINMYITVSRKTGVINFCDELRTKAHTIQAKKSSSRRAHGKATVFYTKAWGAASYLEDEDRSVEECKVIAQNYFVAMHDWWSARDSRWNVVVKKNGDRVTFGVDNSQTPYYFKDRDKSIKTASGQTKKIVHYVKEHERKVNDKTTVVKEHIRGLQEFDWAGYHCQVVSPKFQAKTAAAFTLPSEDVEDTEPSNVVYLSKVGKMLADAEETHRPKEKNA